jgi:hypothetical protein
MLMGMKTNGGIIARMLLAYHMKQMMILHSEELLPMSAYTNPFEEN